MTMTQKLATNAVASGSPAGSRAKEELSLGVALTTPIPRGGGDFPIRDYRKMLARPSD